MLSFLLCKKMMTSTGPAPRDERGMKHKGTCSEAHRVDRPGDVVQAGTRSNPGSATYVLVGPEEAAHTPPPGEEVAPCWGSVNWGSACRSTRCGCRSHSDSPHTVVTAEGLAPALTLHRQRAVHGTMAGPQRRLKVTEAPTGPHRAWGRPGEAKEGSLEEEKSTGGKLVLPS